MVHETDKTRARERRHARVRARVEGNADRPRLCVYRSLKHLYAQVIDDSDGKTLASASTLELRADKKPTGNIEAAKQVGTMIAGRLKEKGMEKVVFDRGGYLYHGRVKAVAEAARAAGLKF